MKKINEDAFLKSIIGTSPLIKKNKVKKPLPENIENYSKKKSINKTQTSQKVKFPKENFLKKPIFQTQENLSNKKLKKGKIPIEKKVDFHGMGILEAEEVFRKTIISCYKKNLRCILFITGKGFLKKNNDSDEKIKLYYGKIRNSFMSWVKKNEINKYILSVEQASKSLGGDGAFLVYLRKLKN